MELLVVTAMSGAGKSTALAALADIGFYCVDNIPVLLLPQLVDVLAAEEAPRRIAVGIDAREVGHLGAFASVHLQLVQAGHRVQILFLDAPTDDARASLRRDPPAPPARQAARRDHRRARGPALAAGRAPPPPSTPAACGHASSGG